MCRGEESSVSIQQGIQLEESVQTLVSGGAKNAFRYALASSIQSVSQLWKYPQDSRRSHEPDLRTDHPSGLYRECICGSDCSHGLFLTHGPSLHFSFVLPSLLSANNARTLYYYAYEKRRVTLNMVSVFATKGKPSKPTSPLNPAASAHYFLCV
jgi:hypothetical protein